MLAILVYLVALAVPGFLLYRFHAQAWYWHVLSIAAGLALGLVPIPAELQKRGVDLLFGFSFVLLLFWGVGGLILPHHAHEKHA